MRKALFGIFLFVVSQAQAEIPDQCNEVFGFNLDFAFEPDLQLSTYSKRVLWKGSVITLAPQQISILKLLLLKRGTVTYDQFHKAVFTGGPIVDPPRSLRTQMFHILQKFRMVDPGFNKIRNVHNVGFYWLRADIDKVQRGRLRVAENHPTAWWDHHSIPLTSREHLLLRRVMVPGRKSVSRESFSSFGISVHKLSGVMRLLNSKFASYLELPLVINERSRTGKGFLKLNPALLELREEFDFHPGAEN